MSQKSCVIFCRCGANVISGQKLDEIAEGLKNFDVHVYELHDLCAFSVNEPDVLKAIDSEFQKKIVIACYPRAVKNMLKQGGVDFGQFEVLNFKELSSEEIFSKLKNEYQVLEGKAFYQTQITKLEVPAWFPVIDESRCTLCGKCARFCLFGVYSFDKKSLKVINPLACKDKCPACGRTCPTSAIMFPRLAENSVLAGDEPGNKKMTVDTGSLLMTLNARNQNRRNIFRQGVVEQAEEERRKALEELKATLSKKN
jgi:heterodisulfide reductase subunit A-like polyferredoxin